MEEKDKKIVRTDEMENVYSLIEQGYNLFITGKAGSGKTTFLRSLMDEHSGHCVVVAPTGVAAINACGVTIHSLFSLPIGVQLPDDDFEWRLPQQKTYILRHIKMLIIDEISMVRCDLLDAIDKRLRMVKRSNKPFGGVQIIMFGDLMQLPPVVTKDEEEVLSNYYDDYYFFNAQVFKTSSFKMVELTEIFRQTDQEYINFLNDVRFGCLSDASLVKMNEAIFRKTSDNTIHLCALRSVADAINKNSLGFPTNIFAAKISGDFNLKNAVCDVELQLKVGARVMMTQNDYDEGYYNGMLGTVVEINNREQLIVVLTDDNKRVFVQPKKVEAYKYDIVVDVDEMNNPVTKIDKKVVGTCTQFPLTLAYAITIHKSQGLTFDSVSLHIKEIFQSGQLYTALSRCRKFENLSMDAKITPDMIKPNMVINNFLEYVKLNNNEYGSKPTNN